ncbi:hypothetical protein [Bryobacter aggregatus]|uniref:hypothetical protein n=1 Tax=Bryobacter aggregatus TaxID=360054 RepID=UPI0004E28B6F|nr:hypothetical protein [Bryobacter aggregatus]
MRVLLYSALVFGSTLQAQTPTCPDKSVLMPVTVEVRERNVLEPIPGLNTSHFLLSGKGIEERAASLEHRLPADIVVLIEDRPRGGLLAGAAALFVKSLLPGDRVAVMTYGVSTKRQLAFSQDPEAIRLAIEKGADGMHVQVARPLYGVVDALKLFGDATPGRQRAIFMLGDDLDNGSQIRVEQLAANLIAERVSLDLAIDPAPSRKIPRVNLPTPTLGNEAPGQRPAVVGQQSVVGLANSSGGDSNKFLDAHYLEIMRERLKNRVTLNYCVQKKHSGKLPRVELTPEAAQKWPGAELRAPGIDLNRN